MKENRVAKGIAKGINMVLIAVVASVVLGWVVKLLWNGLVPPVFGWHTITYWQALGLFVLSKILLGGFRGGGFRGHSRMPWRYRMRECWAGLTPEERERFRQGMRGRCGHAAPAAVSPEG